MDHSRYPNQIVAINDIDITVAIGNKQLIGHGIIANGGNACFVQPGHTAPSLNGIVFAIDGKYAIGSGTNYFFIPAGNINSAVIRQVLSPRTYRRQGLLGSKRYPETQQYQ